MTWQSMNGPKTCRTPCLDMMKFKNKYMIFANIYKKGHILSAFLAFFDVPEDATMDGINKRRPRRNHDNPT